MDKILLWEEWKAKALAWRSEDDLQESVLSLYYSGPRDQVQVISRRDKHLYPLSHLACPRCFLRNKSHFLLKIIFRLCCLTAFNPAPDLQLQRTGYLLKVWPEYILQFEKKHEMGNKTSEKSKRTCAKYLHIDGLVLTTKITGKSPPGSHPRSPTTGAKT